MDLPRQGRYACIHILRKRYRCKDRESTFSHPVDWTDNNHRVTTRFAALALERNLSDW